MRFGFLVLLLCVFFDAHAHNMSDETKKRNVTSAIKTFSPQSTVRYINFEFSEYILSLDALKDFFNSGDQDIEEFYAELFIKETPYELNCDIISGEYLIKENIAQYFMVFKNCSLKNLYSYKIEYISLPLQKWEDWRY